MTKIELIKKYLAEKKRLGEARAAFAAVVAKPFPAPVDLTANDCAGLDDGEALAKYAYTGYATVESLADRRKLLARLIAVNPHGRGRPATAGQHIKITLSLPRELVGVVDEAATKAGVSRNKWLRDAVEKKLKNEER